MSIPKHSVHGKWTNPAAVEVLKKGQSLKTENNVSEMGKKGKLFLREVYKEKIGAFIRSICFYENH